jgi:CMP-N,N'-diacetyllegionaminic acid synthase
MRILGLITARGGSKGLPGKNMILLGGIPLVEYTFRDSTSVSGLETIILSTDMPEAIQLALEKYPRVEAPFVRPKNLCEDNSSHADVVKHALDFMEEKGHVFDAVVLFQPTTPFRRVSEIEEGVALLRKGADSVLGVSKVMHHPAEYLYKAEDGKLKFLLPEMAGKRRQEYPDMYFDNGAFYGFTTRFFREHGKFFNDESQLLLMSEKSLIDIDTPFDLAVASGVLTMED